MFFKRKSETVSVIRFISLKVSKTITRQSSIFYQSIPLNNGLAETTGMLAIGIKSNFSNQHSKISIYSTTVPKCPTSAFSKLNHAPRLQRHFVPPQFCAFCAFSWQIIHTSALSVQNSAFPPSTSVL